MKMKIAKVSADPGDSLVPFGKYKGQPLKLVEYGYLAWLANDAGYPPAQAYLDNLISAGEVLSGVEYPTVGTEDYCGEKDDCKQCPWFFTCSGESHAS